ncbi:hypothetical protein ACFL1D_04400 [Candidatus Omnitrophota bacterium]
MYQTGLWRLNKGLIAFFCLLFCCESAEAAYVKEAEAEVLTGAGQSQNSAYYTVIGTISQPTPLTTLNTGYVDSTNYRVYPGYIANLNTRIIAQYGLEMQDTAADTDSDENTQVAGVYFPLALTAYDGYGYTARSDSGTQLDLAVNPSLLNFGSDQLTLTQGQANTDVYETAAGKYSLTVSAADVRNKSAVLNLGSLEIKPAWINNYTVSATSPQKEGVQWSERVFSWDAYGNLVKAWDYLTVHFDPADVQATESGEYSPACALEFYPALGLPSSGGTGDYTLQKSEGRAFIYVMANQTGNAQIDLDGQSYNYTIGPSDPGVPAAYNGVSNPIVIQPINWLIDAQFVYDYSSAELKASGWLERDGKLVTAGLGQADLYIYDKAGTWLNTLSGILDGQSVYQFSWPGASLSEPTYFARLVITNNSLPYTSNFSFNIDPAHQFTQEISQELVTRMPLIEAAMDETAEEVATATSPLTEAISQDADKILVASETSIPSQVEATRESLLGTIISGVLNASTQMQQGREYQVDFQTYTGVSPVLDVYDPEGNIVLSEQAMQEVEDSGVYRTEITFESSWPRGNYTLVCSEPTHGTMDASTVLVTLSGIEDISQDASTVLGSTSGFQDVKDLSVDIEKSLDALQVILEEILNKSVAVVREQLAVRLETTGVSEIEEASRQLYENLLEIKRRIADMGLVAQPVVEAIALFDESKKTDLNYLKEKFVQVQAVLKLHNEIMDTYANEPVIETWYEFR